MQGEGGDLSGVAFGEDEGGNLLPAIRKDWIRYNARHEAIVWHYYLDVKGLVTVGVGNLVDPVEMAKQIRMVAPGGREATSLQIDTEWRNIKTDPRAKDWRFATRLTALRLHPDELARLVDYQLDRNDSYLAKRFPNFRSWPADAQFAIHSLSWAAGAGFRFPKLETALLAGDFLTASKEVDINEPGTAGRNADNRALLIAASTAPAGSRELTIPLKLAASVPPVPPPGDLVGKGEGGGGESGAIVTGIGICAILALLAKGMRR
jgi:hypothetical protein